MRSLVGYTGFVGSNLNYAGRFERIYNSRNIREAFGTRPDILYYAGVRGTKFLAVHNPEEDLKHIETTIENIKKINPKKLVLISTVDVYDDLDGKDEDYTSDPDSERLHAYGRHRLMLEEWVKEYVRDFHVVRLPAVYGDNLKKNFVYDLIHIIPAMLSQELMDEMLYEIPDIESCYIKQKNGFFTLQKLDEKTTRLLRKKFLQHHINALNFTDSRAQYQFFDLAELACMLDRIIEENIRIMNIVTYPIQANEIFRKIYHKDFVNEIEEKPISYNLTSKYAGLWGQKKYLRGREITMRKLEQYIRKEISRISGESK